MHWNHYPPGARAAYEAGFGVGWRANNRASQHTIDHPDDPRSHAELAAWYEAQLRKENPDAS